RGLADLVAEPAEGRLGRPPLGAPDRPPGEVHRDGDRAREAPVAGELALQPARRAQQERLAPRIAQCPGGSADDLSTPDGSDPGMNPQAARAAYIEASVRSATPERLVVLLYDGAIRFLYAAATSAREGRREIAREKLRRAQAIIDELNRTLDMNQGEI